MEEIKERSRASKTMTRSASSEEELPVKVWDLSLRLVSFAGGGLCVFLVKGKADGKGLGLTLDGNSP